MQIAPRLTSVALPLFGRVLDAMMLDVAEAVQALSRATRAERVRRRVAEMREAR